MNGITEQNEDYQTLLQVVDEYSGRLGTLHLPAETMKLIDCYARGYNAVFTEIEQVAYLSIKRLVPASVTAGSAVMAP